MPSSVAWACNLCRGTKVMELWFNSTGRVRGGYQLACPFQAKGWAMWLGRRLWVSWFLEWRELREAGFTEQRLPPAPGSGRITGWCLPVPNKTRWVHPKWTITFFFLVLLISYLIWVLLWIFNSFVILSGFLWKV